MSSLFPFPCSATRLLLLTVVCLQPLIAAQVAPVTCSTNRGFFTSAFNLTLSTTTTGAEIRYTINGDPPTAITGTVFDPLTPIPLGQTTILRVAAFKSGLDPSNVTTQTYVFLADVVYQSWPYGAAPAGWPPASSSYSYPYYNYGMDPDVVGIFPDPAQVAPIIADLKTIPSFSLVMKLEDLFDPATGIYQNSGREGREWERSASLELINPNGSPGFQINCGVRIRGGFSSSPNNPKHGFRMFFRSEYGTSKLEFPLFGNAGTSSFDKIDLRTFNNYSWHLRPDGDGGPYYPPPIPPATSWPPGQFVHFIHDQFSRDTQLAMGHQGERGGYYHLYLNGQYWGLYNTCERPDAAFAESYFGGDKDDYDTIKTENWAVEATDGDLAAWNQLFDLIESTPGLVDDALYRRAQGFNPDGSPNATYERLLDPLNLVDYMLLIFYTGNFDAPVMKYLRNGGNNAVNNFFAVRKRGGAWGFRYVAHDSEHTLLDPVEDRTGPFPAGAGMIDQRNPQLLFQYLCANPEFRQLVADRIQRHFFADGVFTPASAAARFQTRANQLDRAVVGESARWGDAHMFYTNDPFTRADWLSAVNHVLTSYLPGRTTTVLAQLQADNLYTISVPAPSFSHAGGTISPPVVLTITRPGGSGNLYYTIDGSDPRQEFSHRGTLFAGTPGTTAVNGGATGSVNVNVTGTMLVRARVYDAGIWSALTERAFSAPVPNISDLRITEIMYNPLPSDPVGSDEYEFIELKNTGTSTIPLAGVTITAGISYTFPVGASVPAGGFVVLPRNLIRFNERYGHTASVEFTGSLSNGGERITLNAANGSSIASVAYDDVAPWPTTPDGGGMSLVTKLHNPTGNPDVATVWKASSHVGGSPGTDDPPAAPDTLVATVVSMSAIDLTWTDRAADETSMEIARSSGGGFTTIATLAANTTAFSDTGLAPATAYTYRVRALGSSVASAWSATASATTLAPPPPTAPNLLTITSVSANVIALSWVDTASNETSFELERDAGAGFVVLTSTVTDVVTYSDGGLSAGTTYVYRVRAVNAGGPSAWSDSASATTPAGQGNNGGGGSSGGGCGLGSGALALIGMLLLILRTGFLRAARQRR